MISLLKILNELEINKPNQNFYYKQFWDIYNKISEKFNSKPGFEEYVMNQTKKEFKEKFKFDFKINNV